MVMSRSGALDPLYIKARRILLDALDALAPHRSSVVLVGAQAVYLLLGDRGVSCVAPYTTDADMALDPRGLCNHPLLADALQNSGFRLHGQPGCWIKEDIPLDNSYRKRFTI
jgi:hypothetical protein